MVSFGELEVTNKIGEGAAGSVWRGSWRGAAVAVKVRRVSPYSRRLKAVDLGNFGARNVQDHNPGHPVPEWLHFFLRH